MYFGQFDQDLIHGEGNFIFTTKEFFRGNFNWGSILGTCVYISNNGDIFVGNLIGNDDFEWLIYFDPKDYKIISTK